MHAEAEPQRDRSPVAASAEASLTGAQAAAAALRLVERLAEAAPEAPTKALTVLAAAAAEVVGERTRRGEPPGSRAASRRTVLGRVHAKLAAIELEFIERGDRILSFRVRRELDESKAARATRLSIGADVDADDLSRRCECLVETILCRVEAQVSDEYFPWNGCFLPFESCRPFLPCPAVIAGRDRFNNGRVPDRLDSPSLRA